MTKILPNFKGARVASVFDTDGWKPIFQPLGNEAGIGGIDLYRTYLPDQQDFLLPMIAVYSICDDEINDLAADTQNHAEVIDDYSSYFWFSDRASYAASFRAARIIAKGGKVEMTLPARTLVDISEIGGKLVDVRAVLSDRHVMVAM